MQVAQNVPTISITKFKKNYASSKCCFLSVAFFESYMILWKSSLKSLIENICLEEMNETIKLKNLKKNILVFSSNLVHDLFNI